MRASSHALVTRTEELQAVADEARAAGRVALDTEFMREKTYRARLCLVQVAVPGAVSIVDPLGPVELDVLADLLQDPAVQIVVHAGRQDLELMVERFGSTPTNVFDVQMAAAFAGYGASMPYGRLVEAVVGVTLDKAESYSDWCNRPLTRQQIGYAADDVRFLLEVADRLQRRIRSQGRTSWVEEEMRLLEAPETYSVDLDEVWRKVGGRGSLSARQASVLRELARWREEKAAERDIPRNWVIRDPTLVELARRMPTSVTGLRAIRGLSAGEADRSGNALVETIGRGKAAPPLKSPAGPPRHVQARARMLAGLADAVVRARCEQAQIASEVVATRGELEALLAEVVSGTLDGSHHRLLQGWRREVAGDAVIALAEGRIAVKAVDRPPYVKEVSV